MACHLVGQVAQRHWNAHAFINIAVWLSVDAGNAIADSADATSATIKAARVVFGYSKAAKGAASWSFCASCS